MNPSAKVSVFVVTGNEEINIRRCLDSVVGWSDDVHVVDSDSTDKTVEIAKEYTPNVVNHTYVDHASQLTWAFENLPFKHDWVLFLDADNIVSEELREKIDEQMEKNEEGVNGYYCIHKEYFRDRPVMSMKKWWARLVRYKFAKIDNSELVDYGIKIQGKVGYIHAPILEDNLKEREIDFWIDKHQRFARRMAVEEVLRKHGYIKWAVEPKFFGTSDQHRVWLKNKWMHLPLFFRPFLYWAYRYFIKGAVLQGLFGLSFTVIQALWFRIICDMKVQEIEWAIRDGKLTADELWAQYGSKSLQGDIVGRRDPGTGKI
jgi:glycosyltransferase involved in cell wall biosynthesis